MNERAAIGAGGAGGSSTGVLTRVLEMVRHYGLNEDPLIRQELADVLINDARRQLHEPAGPRQDQAGPAARPRDVDRQAGRSPTT